MIIEVTNLVKKYKEHTAVDGLDLCIHEGEIFGLLGPNGAGKSTTMNALLGLLKMNGGTVKMFGKDYSKHAREIKRYVGYVPQEIAFFETLNAIDNVTYWGRLYRLRGDELDKAVQEALEFTGLWDRRKDRASTFSGGMKRRLNIACAIVHKPRILFMDEPTVGVDPQSRNSILESIKTMNQNGTTVIYTTHYMEEIEAICGRVAIMDFGKIIALGTIDELIDSISEENRINMGFVANTERAVTLIEKAQGVIACNNNEGMLRIRMEKDEMYLTALLENLIQNGFKIKSMTLEKSNLETVFLQLTGKKLRD
ncbi:ABC transporter ATP-binding protein [Paenibacillus sp. NPDC057934]|uniref:ABC transporter ATP-binding protein n=1 Tax=Paenibacillus sp. NPDC057934 TaxID=3346282 RepID=UPI0036DBF85A